jgi:hypothetical protein
MFRLAVTSAVLAMSLTGCGTTLQVSKPDPSTGYYATLHKLAPSDVRVEEKFDPVYKEMVYLKFDAQNPNPKFVKFFTESIRNLGTFKVVADKNQLQQLVIEKNLGDKIQNLDDVVALNKLSKETGPFLIVEPDATWQGGYSFNGTLKAIDSRTGKTVLWIDTNAINMAGLDSPLYYPMLNGFINWTHNEPVATGNVAAKQGT